MSEHLRFKKGLNIPIKGEAVTKTKKSIISDVIALKPTDFKGIIPKLLLKEGDIVKAGTPVYTDKLRPEIIFTSPVSGTVDEIVRGDKRKLLEIRIKVDQETDYIQFETLRMESAKREEIIDLLLKSGLWTMIKQRPYGTIPDPNIIPRDIFISGFNSAPLAADVDFTMRDEMVNIQLAVDALKKLTSGYIQVGLHSFTHASTPIHKLKNVIYNTFDGPHPVGNVGIQIHHVSPVNKGETVWTVDLHHLAIMGRLLSKGIVNHTKLIAVTGPRTVDPCYVETLPGVAMKDFGEFFDIREYRDADINPEEVQPIRVISGNVLTGENVGVKGYLGFFDTQITLLSEGDYYEMVGWAKPIRPKKFSISKSYFSWLTPKKLYNMDTNLNGGERAFVMPNIYEKVLPMDIYPVYLLKAILANDIDKMEQLGIYEVIEEDFALCEYICPCKIEIQSIISQGIESMLKEMA